jgi:hypothetical protein
VHLDARASSLYPPLSLSLRLSCVVVLLSALSTLSRDCMAAILLGEYLWSITPSARLSARKMRQRERDARQSSRDSAKEYFEKASSSLEAAAKSALFQNDLYGTGIPFVPNFHLFDYPLYGNLGYVYWQQAGLCHPRGRKGREESLDVHRASAQATELYEKAKASYKIAFKEETNSFGLKPSVRTIDGEIEELKKCEVA